MMYNIDKKLRKGQKPEGVKNEVRKYERKTIKSSKIVRQNQTNKL